MALTVALLIWAGHSLARMIWLLASPGSDPQSDKVSAAVPPASSPVESVIDVDLRALQRAFVFTQRDASAVSAALSPERNLADTRLNLTLHGTVLSTDHDASQAIISSGSAQHVYRPGDELRETRSGVHLRQVQDGVVLLDNNGREEVLRMYDRDEINEGAVMPGSSEGQPPEPVKMASERPWSDIVRLQVYQQNGQVQGLQIRHGSRQDLLSAAGLQVGDLITRIGNTPVNNPAQLPELFRQLDQQSSVSLAVLRDGETLTVDVSRDRLTVLQGQN